MTEYKVGDTVYYVPRRGQPDVYTVSRIGRKYIYCKRTLSDKFERQFTKDHGEEIDGVSLSILGRVYPSKEFYTQKCELDKQWADFRWDVYNKYLLRPENLSLEDLEQIKQMLGLQ